MPQLSMDGPPRGNRDGVVDHLLDEAAAKRHFSVRRVSGCVVVLDPRILTKPYGRRFLEALPEGVRVELLDPDDPS